MLKKLLTWSADWATEFATLLMPFPRICSSDLKPFSSRGGIVKL
jgi:hypothetical protein